MELTQHRLTTRDGRTLEYGTVGNPEGKTVVFHHGTPGSLFTLMQYQEIVELGGFFAISYSRAGYGKSSRNQGRAISDVVSDIGEILDELGRDSYVSVGWSGGGPHSLACAALDPRCTGALSVAGVAPADVDFDWTEGMGSDNIAEFELAKTGGPEYEAHARAAGESFANATAETIIDVFGDLISKADRAAWEPLYIRERAAADFPYAFTVSSDGFIDDDQAFIKSWGFSVGDIKVPVSVWFGADDLMVPSTHGEWLTQNIPGATRHYFAEDGHMSVWLNHLPEIAADIASK